MPLAMISLPVPVSPLMRMLESLEASRRRTSKEARKQVGHPGALPYKILQAVAAVHPGQILVEAPEAGGLVAELGEHLFQPAQVAHRDGAHHADDPLPVQDGKQAGDTGPAMELQKEIGPGLAGAQHLLEGGELVQH